MKKTACTLAVLSLLVGCASLNSVETKSAGNGMAYYMPKRDVIVTVTVKDGRAEKAVVTTSAAYPDTSRQYLLQYSNNLFGKNTLDLAVTDKGLLTSAKSTSTSNVLDVFKGLATAAGAFNPLSDSGAGKCMPGDHVFVYSAMQMTADPCGLKIAIEALSTSSVGHAVSIDERVAGVFYRQQRPYRVRAKGDGWTTESIVFSPSESPTQFLPIARTFFANNEATIGFEDGLLKTYKQDADGELVALFKLPAEVLASYFSAVGTTFDNLKGRDQKEAAAISETVKLELAKRKVASCLAAIKANNSDLIKQLEC